jgi:hypothetical protein
MRNPSVYWAPYRIKADRLVADFLEMAAQANTSTGVDQDYTFNVENPLSQDNNFDVGLQPGRHNEIHGGAMAIRLQRVHHEPERRHLRGLEPSLSEHRE